MDIKTKIKLITCRLQEVLDEDGQLEKILEDRSLKIYWGTAPTKTIHFGYLVPLLKISDFLQAGCEVKILLADIHAKLDNGKSSKELVKYRTEYYEKMIKCILNNLNIPVEKLIFVIGSSFQLTEKYVEDVYELSTLISFVFT